MNFKKWIGLALVSFCVIVPLSASAMSATECAENYNTANSTAQDGGFMCWFTELEMESCPAQYQIQCN
jgi:hypothetical protein